MTLTSPDTLNLTAPLLRIRGLPLTWVCTSPLEASSEPVAFIVVEDPTVLSFRFCGDSQLRSLGNLVLNRSISSNDSEFERQSLT